ncbi:MAG: Trk system potassium transporter TrkA [Spirochaetes bacterium]|jgi:trk system potassium uptake protein TrkA|nr:Trk system potassium transporter TrkA [Spirochaetota bacterium]
MKVVIVGAGAVGFQLARQLIAESRDVVLIEKDPAKADHAANRLDCMVIQDVGNNLDVLRRAGTESADFFLSVTDSDEVNLIACGLAASEFERPYRIARVRNIDYTRTRISEKSFLGIDYIVNPEIEAANAILRSIERGAVSDVMLFEQGDVQMRNVTVSRGSYFLGKTLQQASMEADFDFLVAAVLRENDYIIPSGDTVIHEGDVLYIAANEANFERLFERLGKEKRALNRMVLVGGGRIGNLVVRGILDSQKKPRPGVRKLLHRLSTASKQSIKVVERDYHKSKQLAEQFPEALVINADIADEGIFEEEHFANSDLVIATTENQELNIVTAIYAKTLGIKRSVVLVNKANYTKIAANLGIDVAVSLKSAVVSSILKLIRRGRIKSLHTISDGKLEVLEFEVDASSRAADTSIRELKLPGNSLVVSRSRGGKHIIPRGDDRIEADDHVVVIVKKDFVDRVQNYFSVA